MAIQGFNIEEDNEEIRDEIEEGVNMYEEDKTTRLQIYAT